MFRFEVSYQNDSKIWVDLSDWVRPITDKSTLDETHDESQIFLSCSSIDTPFKPFTHFIINVIEIDDETNMEVDRNTLYRVVIADEIEQVVFDEDRQLYDHNIRLAEATKELERYTVDNLSFTNYWAKAFQTAQGNFQITKETSYDGWYNNGKTVTRVNDKISTIFRPNRFSNPFANDSYTVPTYFVDVDVIKTNTYIDRVVNDYNNSGYSINSNLQTSYITNSVIQIPNITIHTNAEREMYNYDYRVLWTGNVISFIIEFSTSVSVFLQRPNGTRIAVNQGQNVTLDTQGEWKVIYQVTRHVRDKYTEKGYIVGIQTKDILEYTDFMPVTQVEYSNSMLVLDDLGSDIEKLSVYDILNKLCQVTPTRFKDTDQQKFFISQDCRTRYGAIEAPELIITGKNLWEALKIIGGIINAIPYLKIEDPYNWNVIDFMPLSSEERTANTVEEEYCNSESGYLSDSYTASYDVYAENMINPLSTNEGQINEAGWYIGKTVRSETVEISEDSMDIETVYPIYRINKLKWIGYYFDDNGNRIFKEGDCTRFVEEKSLYDTEYTDDASLGKSTHVYYTQGAKGIHGLEYKVHKNNIDDAQRVIAIKNILFATIGSADFDINDSKFIVEYVPYLNARIRYFKTNAPKLNIDTSMFQNQSSNVIDTIALGRKMVANLGRTSNLGYVDSIKVYHLNEIPVKGQRTADGYFVSDVVVEYDQNHLLASVSYTRDYQKISDYINIQNLQRYFEVSEKQSLDRYVNTHMFYIFGDPIAEINKEFGLNQSADPGANYPTTNYISSLLYDHGYNRKINGSLINSYGYNYQLTSDLTYQADKAYYTQTGDRYDYLVPDVDYTIGGAIEQPNTTIYDTTLDKVARLYLNSNAISSGNQISIITDFQDNYGAGSQSIKYTDDRTFARQKHVIPYANQYGEVKEMKIYNLTDSNINYPSSGNATLEANMTKLANALPAVCDLDANNQPIQYTDYFKIADSYAGDNIPTMSAVGCEQTIQLNKDSREIIHINQQHHFLKNKDDLIIGNAMTEKCRFIQQTSFKSRLVFLSDTIDDYEFKIKADDIITVQPVGTDERLTRSTILTDLCNEIKASNILEILSAENRDGIQINTRYSGANITGVSVNQSTWESYVQYSGFYTFIYDGSSWTYAEETVDLADYGITITGTAEENDTITVQYNTSVFIQPLVQYNGQISGLTADAKAWAIIVDGTNDLIIGQNMDLYADDLTHDNYIPPIYMSVTSQY